MEQEKTHNNEEINNEVLDSEEIENNTEETQELDEKKDIQNLEDLQEKLDEKEKQCADLKDRLQRTMAEFDNFRKRTSKEKSVLYEDGIRNTVEQILPVIDNFQRALSVVEKEAANETFFQGMEMIYRQFKEILTSIGVEEIKAVGEKFDPNLHNAVTHVEDEEFGESEVVEEFQKGYIFKDKVIRYSMVKVAN